MLLLWDNVLHNIVLWKFSACGVNKRYVFIAVFKTPNFLICKFVVKRLPSDSKNYLCDVNVLIFLIAIQLVSTWVQYISNQNHWLWLVVALLIFGMSAWMKNTAVWCYNILVFIYLKMASKTKDTLSVDALVRSVNTQFCLLYYCPNKTHGWKSTSFFTVDSNSLSGAV